MKSFRIPFCRVVMALAVWVGLIAILGIVPGRLVAADTSSSAVSQTSASSAAIRSVTIFPIVINSGGPMPDVSADMSKNMAELVGLFLERGGMKDIEIADAKFAPPEKAELAKTAEAFAQFVKPQKLKTEYAIFVQFFGKPGTGAVEIRLAVVDRQGKIVLTDRLDQQQLLAHGAKKVDPMLACYYTFQELRAFWGLADSERKDASEGKMAKLWAEKAARPPKKELDAMPPRLKTLQRTIQSNTVAVFVQVSGKSDPKAAEELASMLTHDGLGQAKPGEGDVRLRIQPSTNQTRILWDMARGFREFLRKNPPSADYALLANYGIGRSPEGKPIVGGVELILCDRAGDWVWLGLKNDDHPDFQRIDPHSANDCNRLAVEVLKQNLSPQ
ncbi:MAG: hypothetical protein ABFC54_07660 [Thermoguttaceae bacterium]